MSILWTGRYNFRDKELKFCILYNFHTTSWPSNVKTQVLEIKNFSLFHLLLNLMDLLNMTNRAKIHEFYKNVK